MHPLFHQKIVGPNIRKEPTNQAAVDDVLSNVQPKILGYLDSQIDGNFLVGAALLEVFQRAVADEKPFAEQMGLSRGFLGQSAGPERPT